MDKETEQTPKLLALWVRAIPLAISMTAQSSEDTLISENFPNSRGIRFPPYPGPFGSDPEFGVLASQPTTQESIKSSLLGPDSCFLFDSDKKKTGWFWICDQISGENGGSKAAKRSKQDGAGSSKNGIEKCDSKGNTMDDAKPPEPPKDYIHVRARRGHATDSHSLAETVLNAFENPCKKRENHARGWIALLQNLVPGCNRITGEAVMIDEIINYVQSLQRQVEFLSMKLATVKIQGWSLILIRGYQQRLSQRICPILSALTKF